MPCYSRGCRGVWMTGICIEKKLSFVGQYDLCLCRLDTQLLHMMIGISLKGVELLNQLISDFGKVLLRLDHNTQRYICVYIHVYFNDRHLYLQLCNTVFTLFLYIGIWSIYSYITCFFILLVSISIYIVMYSYFPYHFSMLIYISILEYELL